MSQQQNISSALTILSYTKMEFKIKNLHYFRAEF